MLRQIQQTENQLAAAVSFFNEARIAPEVDQAIYQVNALKAQYNRLFALAKEQGVNAKVRLCPTGRIKTGRIEY